MLPNVLTALAVVSLIGIVFGILLALFLHLFGVEEDEKTKEIRDALPGINCGSCGYKGCSDYAEALAKGEADPSLCVPGAEATAKRIGEILGVEVAEPKDVVAFVHCNGNCDVTVNKAVVTGIPTCRALSMTYGGPKLCSYGCLGCGDCAAVCISNAITVENGVAKVDTSRCLGCGMCAKECPKKLISMIPQEAAVAVLCSSKDKGADSRKACKNACIGCKKCEKTCQSGAVTVVDNCAVIDYSKCTGCGLCAEACPTGSLKKVFLPDLPEGFSLK